MYHRIFLTKLLAALLVLAGCSAGPAPRPVAEPAVALADTWPAPVGQVHLQRMQAPPEVLLDVGLVSFDPGLPEDQAGLSRRGIFPEIRRAEARYLPVLLRQQLQQSNAWGAVRVLPEPQQASELQLQGSILHSDGELLVLQVTARDASGRLWLDQVYVDETTEEDYPVVAGEDPFGDLHRRIANDLLAFQRSLDAVELQRIRQIALLRHASGLAPEVFADFLQRGPEGRYQLLRLPAAGDPMLARVERLRDQEYLFIDTVDEQYVDLYREMAPTYDLWRQYGREQAQYKEDYQRRLAQRDSAGARGSYAAMEQTYNAFKWSKIQQQDLEELARGFNNEIQPTVLDVSGTVFRLSGSLESQYDEWRQILRSIFVLESGLD